VQLKVDGVLISDHEKKAEAMDSFYGELLGSSSERAFSLDLDYMGVQLHDLSEREAPFSKEDVWGGHLLQGIMTTLVTKIIIFCCESLHVLEGRKVGIVLHTRRNQTLTSSTILFFYITLPCPLHRILLKFWWPE
jgi:hypothetical protein